jgi:curli biogenesis system outer membrane secretion channel CsgG
MKKVRLYIVCVLAISTLYGCALPGVSVNINQAMKDHTPKRVAILPLEDYDQGDKVADHYVWWMDFTPNNGQVVSDIFTTEFIQLPQFQCIERTQIAKILKEHDLSLTGLLDNKSVSEVGKILGVDAIILGKVALYYNWYNSIGLGGGVTSFTLRMVQTETGTILWSASVNRDVGGRNWAIDLTREACKEIVRQLREGLDMKKSP